MIISKFENRDLWLAARQGKITGTRVKDILVKRGTGKKKGYYELIAERLAIPADGEDVRDRGLRLESEALERFSKATGKKVTSDLVIWSREDNQSIAVSPDGVVEGSNDTEALDAKCLSSASHLEAFLTNAIPAEYVDQGIQYFCVNDLLETLHFCFYDPRLGELPCAFFVISMHRKDLEKQIAEYLEYERIMLIEIDGIVNKLSGF